jgi:hypothetical protein
MGDLGDGWGDPLKECRVFYHLFHISFTSLSHLFHFIMKGMACAGGDAVIPWRDPLRGIPWGEPWRIPKEDPLGYTFGYPSGG